jgi:DNA-directed RNA polymerase specialized sigma24 family protein
MDDDATHLGLEEVRRILRRLREPEIVRLAALARTWAKGLRQHDADDLIDETFERVLSGHRPWPIAVPLPAFSSQVMRSIRSQWLKEERREPLREDVTGYVRNDDSDDPGSSYETGHLVAQMRRQLVDDPPALGVLDHILADSDRAEAQAALDLDATGYDTVRRRMVSRLLKVFHAGWSL